MTRATCFLFLLAACGADITPDQTASAPGDAPPPGATAGPSAPVSPAPAATPTPQPSPTLATIPKGKVPMLVAQGQLGRTMVSCDDGKTWKGNHSWDIDGDALMCGQKQNVHCGDMCNYFIGGTCVTLQCCDDTSDIAEGVAFANGTFVGYWGHGKPGAIRTSTNGVDWSTTHTGDNLDGVAWGSGRFVAIGYTKSYWSSDGKTWTAGGKPSFNTGGSPVRSFGYGDYKGAGRFVAVSAGGGLRDINVSSDGGATWRRPTTIPADCALGVGTNGGDIMGFNDLLVIVDTNGNACRSTDGGDTWTVSPTGVTSIVAHGAWTGSELVYWGDKTTMITSKDGATWTKTAMTTPTQIGPAARSLLGTYVGLRYVYDAYDRQHLLRSTDGLNWQALPVTDFVQSHAIFHITAGYGDPSTVCPL